jgi:hypothetical protein
MRVFAPIHVWVVPFLSARLRSHDQAAGHATTDHLGIASRCPWLHLLAMMRKEEGPGLAAIQAILG